MKSQVPILSDVPTSILHEKLAGGTCDNITEVELCYIYSGCQGMRNPPTHRLSTGPPSGQSRTPGLRVKKLLTLRNTYKLWDKEWHEILKYFSLSTKIG